MPAPAGADDDMSRMVLFTDDSITVCPPKTEDGYWRATWYQPNGERRGLPGSWKAVESRIAVS
jgi:hypothetical protein